MAKDEKQEKQEKSEKSDKPLFLLRVIAYVIDMMIVLMLSSLLATPFLDSKQVLSLADESRELVQKYDNHEITDQEYLVDVSNLQYKMARNTELVTIFTILVSVCYFVILPLFYRGQTFGKKLMKMKIISDVGTLNSNQLIFRSFLANSLLLNIITVLFVMFASRDIYLNCVELFTFAQYTVMAGSIFMLIFGKEGLTIHDAIVHTRVIKVN